MVKLPDIVAVCNMIKAKRKDSRENYFSKAVCVRLDVGEKYFISSFVKLRVNKRNGMVSLSVAGLRTKGHDIYPGRNQKFCCTNQHALDVLERKRDRQREYNEVRYARAKELSERDSVISACAFPPADCESSGMIL